MSNSRFPLRHVDIELLKNEKEVEIEKEKKQGMRKERKTTEVLILILKCPAYCFDGSRQ